MKRKPKDYNKFKEEYCVICGHSGKYFQLDVDHVKTLASGGKDEPFNLMTLCRICHIEKGSKPISEMANKYPNYRQWLLKNNWYFEFGKWRNNENS